MRLALVVPSLLLLAACGGATASPAVAPEPPGPDHLLALSPDDLGVGWARVEPPTPRGCLGRSAAALDGAAHREVVALARGEDGLVQDIWSFPAGSVPDHSALESIRTTCPRASGPEPTVSERRGSFGLDPLLRRDETSWSFLQVVDTGVVVTEVQGLELGRAYAAFDRRRDAWQRERTAAARDLWEEKGPSSYTMTYELGCFCPSGAYRVSVVDGKVTHGVYAPDGSDHVDRVRTVDDLFGELQDLEEPTYTAQFDPELGYPTAVSVDSILEAIDDEFGVRITDLAPS